MMENVGHMPMLEAPDQLSRVVLDFLAAPA